MGKSDWTDIVTHNLPQMKQEFNPFDCTWCYPKVPEIGMLRENRS